jgi:hypothetical protein
LRVQGFLAEGGTWEELSTTTDVSSGGACFPLGHDVELGQVLLLSLPLPKRLRQFDLNDVTYRVYTLVRGVRRRAELPRVGVMFFGKYPPRGFQERPAARYLLPTDSVVNAPVPHGLRAGDTPMAGTPQAPQAVASDGPGGTPDDTPPAVAGPSTLHRAPAGVPPPPLPGAPAPQFLPTEEVPRDRRGSPRVQLFVNFTIQLVDEWGAVLQEELTVADNVGRGGARVMTSLAFQVGDVILLQEAGGGFATRAEVRGISRIQPAIDRLHLCFLDRHAPERLLRQ